jgi:hypothetical protein
MINCYPVQLNDVFMIRELFLATFRGGTSAVGYTRFDPKTLKHFQESFPSLGSDDVKKFLHWHNALVDFCARYGIYCPPAHTLRPGQHLGIWFNDLPKHVQLDAQKHFANVLTGCLRSKLSPSVRQDHPMIANIIQHGSTNGYKILYLLTEEAGNHPLLERYPSVPLEPTQTANTTIEQYTTAWTQYLQHMLLDGTVYCDRYFMQQYQRNLYPAVKQMIGPHLRQEISDIPIDIPLPPEFAPDRLNQLLHSIGKFIGNHGLVTKTPRELYQQTTQQPVRSLYQSQHAEHGDNDIDLPAIVAALSNTDARTCYLCAAEDHQMIECPTYQRLRDNPRAVTAILRSLTKSTRGNHNRRNGPPRHIRQLCDTIPNDIGEGLATDLKAGEGQSIDDNETTIHANNDLSDDILDQDFH